MKKYIYLSLLGIILMTGVACSGKSDEVSEDVTQQEEEVPELGDVNFDSEDFDLDGDNTFNYEEDLPETVIESDSEEEESEDVTSTEESISIEDSIDTEESVGTEDSVDTEDSVIEDTDEDVNTSVPDYLLEDDITEDE